MAYANIAVAVEFVDTATVILNGTMSLMGSIRLRSW